MARPAATGQKRTDLLPLILTQLRLEGEDIVRVSTGRVVRFTPQAKRGGYGQVGLAKGWGNPILVSYHRAKFALTHGYLPTTVDHASRERADNSNGNLRGATSQEQNRNRARPGGQRRSDWPRGVTRRRSGRFTAAITVDRRAVCLGTYDTPEEASAVVEEKLREVHGEFYRCHDLT